jgi:uncharacterized protein YkwD
MRPARFAGLTLLVCAGFATGAVAQSSPETSAQFSARTSSQANKDNGMIGDPATSTVPFAQPTEPERKVLDLTNGERSALGLPALQWSPALAAAALRHAQLMETTSNLSHQLPNEPNLADRAAHAGAHFQAIAENIAYGYSPESIEKEWMRSMPHRTNILDPRMNAVGIALVPGAGTLWAVEDFAATIAEEAPGDVKSAVGAVLVKHGLTLVADSSAGEGAALAACPQFEGGAGAHARFVVRYESADPVNLPQPLLDAVASRQYTQAAVATCAAINARNRDFAAYRVAVLLF